MSHFQDLPTDVLLLIFDQLNHKHLGFLSTICRAFKNAVAVHLRYNTRIHLSNDASVDPGSQSVTEFFEVICRYKTIALSVRKLNVSIYKNKRHSDYVLSPDQSRQIQDAFGINPDQLNLWVGRVIEVDYHGRLLLTLLMCRNLASISIYTQQALNWQRRTQHMPYLHWPNESLRHVDICWETRHMSRFNQEHYLQDIWLLFSAPSLTSLTVSGLQQGNNLYTGNVDRAAIRTIYWPIELEIPSLYHHSYRGEMIHGRAEPYNRPGHVPTAPSRLPITHGFKHLHKLALREIGIPTTWYISLLPCFQNLRYLELSIETTEPPSERPSGYVPDLRIMQQGLERLSDSLEMLVLDIQTPRRHMDWLNNARTGFISLGSIHKMAKLQHASLPWYTVLPSELKDPFAALPSCDVQLPPRLQDLFLTRCEFASPGVITQIVKTALISKQKDNTDLRRIVLQSHIELALRESDFSTLASSVGDVEVLLLKNEISADEYVVQDHPVFVDWKSGQDDGQLL